MLSCPYKWTKAAGMTTSTGKPDWERILTTRRGHPVPLHVQLKEALRQAAAAMAPGTPLPSEPELVAYTRLSRATVRRALEELARLGVVETRRGLGSFTASGPVQTVLSRPEGFTDAMRRAGRKPSTRVLGVRRQKAGAEVALGLGIRPRDDVYFLERLRLIDGRPALLERAHLPAKHVPGLERRDLSGSLYGILTAGFGLRPEQGEESVFAVNADRELAALLEVPVAFALLASIRVSQAAGGVRLEYTRRYVQPDLCGYRVRLEGGAALTTEGLKSPV
jgi:GntR family transcriptional regulator